MTTADIRDASADIALARAVASYIEPVNAATHVDTAFDVRTDAGGKDPDSHSPTLRRYHQILWSKPLPNGQAFDLDEKLRYDGPTGQMALSSDAITHTYANWTSPPRLIAIREQVSAEQVAEFYALGCTIGGYTVFPSARKVDGKWQRSINQSRGMHPRIRDRFDLTLECIRRFYRAEPSPLEKTLSVYAEFFAQFTDFAGYVHHFLLEDLVDADSGRVRFWAPFTDFATDGLPAGSSAEYQHYIDASMNFVRARNARIDAYLRTRSQTSVP